MAEEVASYGGQAVIEGVMMRGSTACAIAMRAPTRAIVVHTEALGALYKSRIKRIPFLRGLLMLWDGLGLGLRALTLSANTQNGEDKKLEGPALYATLTVSLCDIDGIVSGSARLSNSIEFVRCTDLIPGYEPPPSAVSGTSQFTTVKTSPMTRTATADLSDLDYDRNQVHLTATANFTVAVDGNSMTGTIRVRNVEVNTPLGWISPGSCANIDTTITLTKVQ